MGRDYDLLEIKIMEDELLDDGDSDSTYGHSASAKSYFGLTGTVNKAAKKTESNAPLLKSIESKPSKSVSIDKNSDSHISKTSANHKADPLLRRAFIFLEDGEWKRADEYFERVLD